MRQCECCANFQVTLETGFGRLSWIDDRTSAASRFDVQTPGPVAGFAAHVRNLLWSFAALCAGFTHDDSLFSSAVARGWLFGNRARYLSWQVAHSSEPTNSAPGMLGSARIVQLVVLQESKITASATAPPAPHNKLSRLPWTHRVRLQRHTNGEYCQNDKTVSIHFFSFFLTPASKFYRCRRIHAFGRTISRRRFARKSLKHAIELRERLKPCRERDFTDAQFAVSREVTGSFETRCATYSTKFMPVTCLKFSLQIIRVHVDRFRDFCQRKLFA